MSLLIAGENLVSLPHSAPVPVPQRFLWAVSPSAALARLEQHTSRLKADVLKNGESPGPAGKRRCTDPQRTLN